MNEGRGVADTESVEVGNDAYGALGLTVELDGEVVLDDVTATVRPGEVVAVVGGDGAGKSTLLRAIVGLLVPTAGAVRTPDEVGYLPAGAGSWLELSVAENLDFVGGIYGLRGSDLARRRTELERAAGLAEAADRLSSQLSGGMRRKLGFSLAMVPNPPLLVLDEPSTGVDPVSRVDLWRLMSTAAADGAAVLFSTTYLDEAERAGWLIVLDAGRVLVAGAPADVVRGFTTPITRSPTATRPEWSWRRGRAIHELWPVEEEVAPPAEAVTVTPDLEDVVIAMSLLARARPAVESA